MARPLDRNLQARILQAVRDFHREKGYSPSMADLKEMVGVSSKNVIRDYLLILQGEGSITLQPGIPRSIALGRKKD